VDGVVVALSEPVVSGAYSSPCLPSVLYEYGCIMYGATVQFMYSNDRQFVTSIDKTQITLMASNSSYKGNNVS